MAEAVLFGSYELLELVAEGGMAEVWRARSRGAAGFEKIVVIKRVLPAHMQNPSFAELLIREAKIAARLSHANIVQIFDLGEEQGAYFIAMEYVSGKDLGMAMSFERRRARAGKVAEGLPVEVKLWIMAEVAKALDYAHRRRGDDGRPLSIVHRDVSPQNILLGYEGEVKVTDFGIARADDEGLGRGEDPKVLRGKYAYMSPEQARGQPLDRRSDVFSFGIVLYELLARRRLFRGSSATETLSLVRAAKTPDLDTRQLGLPIELRDVLRRSLARDTSERYGTAGEIYTDLAQILFKMGANVGETELAQGMQRMFPPGDAANPNKLRVDLLLRASEDATSGISVPDAYESARIPSAAPGGDSTERTSHALPMSRRTSTERRRIALLVTNARPENERIFDASVSQVGGLSLPVTGSLREASFGHAATGERAAELAVRAALEVRRRASLEGRMQLEPTGAMAVVGGEAIVYGGAAVDPSEATLEKAAALLAHGGAGEIVVDPALSEELSRTFRIGTSSGSTASIVEGYRGRRERDAVVLRRRAPLVGRRLEMEGLSRALVHAAQGNGATVLLLGEPGVGKSRLLAEMRSTSTSQGILFVSGHGDEADTDRSYGALADLFMDLCGVEPEDAPSERFAKVERLRVLGVAPRQIRRVGELLGLEYPFKSDERAGRPRAIELLLAARKALRTLAQDQTVVLALEDVHWMDDPTRQILPLLVRGLARARILIVITARPGAALPSFAGEVHVVEPVDDIAACRLAASALGAEELADDVRDLIGREAAGNPLWIDLVTAALRERHLVEIEQGVAHLASRTAIEVPPAAHPLVAARLAQLWPDDAALLRLVATFEDDVDIALLAAVQQTPVDTLEPAVRRLLARKLLVPARGGPHAPPSAGRWGGGHAEPALPHRVRVASGILRRAILDGMADADVKRLHGRVAAYLERTPTSADDHVDLLAYHCARATDRRRAPEHLVSAAERALVRGDKAAAARRFVDAAQLLRVDGEDPRGERAVEVGLRGAEAALEAGVPAIAEPLLVDLAAAAVVRADAVTRTKVALAHARCAARLGAVKDAMQALEGVAVSLDTLSDGTLRGRALLELGVAQLEGGALGRSLDTLQLASETLAIAEGGVLHGSALCALATALARAGRTDEAERVVSAALAITARIGHGELRLASLAAIADVHEAQGELEAAAARYQEAGQVAHAHQLGAHAGRMAVRAAMASLEAGNAPRAALLAEDALDLGRKHRDDAVLWLARAIAGALQAADEPDRAIAAAIERTVERLEALGRFADAATALRLLSRARSALGDRQAAERSLRRAVALASGGGYVVLESRLAADLEALRAANGGG